MLTARGGPAVRRFAPLRGVAKELALSPDGQLLAACASADGVVLFNASTGERLRTLPLASLHPRVAWRCDSAQVATSGGKGVEVWEAASGSRLATLPAFASVVHSLAMMPEAPAALVRDVSQWSSERASAGGCGGPLMSGERWSAER